MGDTKLIKDGRVMIQGQHESIGEMISQRDCVMKVEYLPREEILLKYKDVLSEKQFEKLKHSL